jgi:predicted RNase H-like HicB family nuclease
MELCISIKSDNIDGGFVAECLNMPGAMSQGETELEALKNLVDAIEGICLQEQQMNSSIVRSWFSESQE